MATETFSAGFIATLADDVVRALERVEADDSATHRREAIRTTFAAIEGIVWIYREHVRDIARSLGYLEPLADLALQEKTYMVGERGELVEQVRFVPLTTMIRLTTKIAQQACPDLVIDFSQSGWADLKQAIIVRNRLTHPKSERDLTIESAELDIAKSGFFWLLETVVEGMSAANVEIARFSCHARVLVDRLASGDEAALRIYRETHMSRED